MFVQVGDLMWFRSLSDLRRGFARRYCENLAIMILEGQMSSSNRPPYRGVRVREGARVFPIRFWYDSCIHLHVCAAVFFLRSPTMQWQSRLLDQAEAMAMAVYTYTRTIRRNSEPISVHPRPHAVLLCIGTPQTSTTINIDPNIQQ